MADTARLLPCRLSHVLIEDQPEHYHVIITDDAGHRRLPIVIGKLEASAIEHAVTTPAMRRPLLADLYLATLHALGATVIAVHIRDLAKGIFYADLVLRSGDGTQITLDCRPSDALGLLVRLKTVPLLVAEHVLAEAAIPISDDDAPSTDDA